MEARDKFEICRHDIVAHLLTQVIDELYLKKGIPQIESK